MIYVKQNALNKASLLPVFNQTNLKNQNTQKIKQNSLHQQCPTSKTKINSWIVLILGLVFLTTLGWLIVKDKNNNPSQTSRILTKTNQDTINIVTSPSTNKRETHNPEEETEIKKPYCEI